ncbi:glycerate kinase [Chloroflexota bacterium]
MYEGSNEQRLLSIFKDIVLPLADSYLATRRGFRWSREQRSLFVGDRQYEVESISRIFLVGAGKAGVPMARAFVDTLKEDDSLWAKFAGGTVNVYRNQATETIPGVSLFAADHPNPNQASLDGARAALELLGRAGTDDLVVAVISGGGSSLLALPQEGITLEDFRLANQALVTGGPTIQKINTVRKHLSQVKGGRLRLAAPGSLFVTLVLSDVIGDDLSSIASGPSVPDATTCNDAVEVLNQHGLWDVVPTSVQDCLLRGDPDEAKKAELWAGVLASRTHNMVVSSNAVILDALEDRLAGVKIEGKTPSVFVEHNPVLGPVDQVVEQNLQQASALAETAPSPALVLFGGEPVVRVRPDATGTGGRMLHYALLAMRPIAGRDIAVLASGTDGIDGTAPAAGAVVTGTTLEEASAAGLEPEKFLANYDSYGFFSALESRTGRRFLNITGVTGTNVNDIMLCLFRT